jgi:hypothetical protein
MKIVVAIAGVMLVLGLAAAWKYFDLHGRVFAGESDILKYWLPCALTAVPVLTAVGAWFVLKALGSWYAVPRGNYAIAACIILGMWSLPTMGPIALCTMMWANAVALSYEPAFCTTGASFLQSGDRFTSATCALPDGQVVKGQVRISDSARVKPGTNVALSLARGRIGAIVRDTDAPLPDFEPKPGDPSKFRPDRGPAIPVP